MDYLWSPIFHFHFLLQFNDKKVHFNWNVAFNSSPHVVQIETETSHISPKGVKYTYDNMFTTPEPINGTIDG